MANKPTPPQLFQAPMPATASTARSTPLKRRPYILGIDPGLSGALAILDPVANEIIKVFDVPKTPSGVKNRNMVDVSQLALELGFWLEDVALCIIEDVHSTPNDGVVQAFSFGKSTGILIGIVGAALLPTYFTPPSVWKNVFGLSSNKDHSRLLASKKYPTASHLFTRKKDDGRAEAVLLAEFGKRFY